MLLAVRPELAVSPNCSGKRDNGTDSKGDCRKRDKSGHAQKTVEEAEVGGRKPHILDRCLVLGIMNLQFGFFQIYASFLCVAE